MGKGYWEAASKNAMELEHELKHGKIKAVLNSHWLEDDELEMAMAFLLQHKSRLGHEILTYRLLASFLLYFCQVSGLPFDCCYLMDEEGFELEAFLERDPDVVLYLGCARATISVANGEGVRVAVDDLIYGEREFSPLYSASHKLAATQLNKMLDSGAYTDRDNRLTAKDALMRQLKFENDSEKAWNKKWEEMRSPYREQWVSQMICSYDWMIPLGLPEAEAAIRLEETVANAKFLSDRRHYLAPRKLMLIVQGRNPAQYRECLERILEFAKPGDCIGFGGWSWLGTNRSKTGMRYFIESMALCIPLLDKANITHVHLMGCMWRPALGALRRMLDGRTQGQHITLSCDSTSPIRSVYTTNKAKAGMWSGDAFLDIALKKTAIANICDSPFYLESAFQLDLLDLTEWLPTKRLDRPSKKRSKQS